MKATIIIPNINGKGWLKDSIESVYSQTEQDFELIVVDNGSTDESLEQARSYCSRPNFQLIENGSNTGFSHAVNQGIAMAESEYVVLFNNDAFAEPDGCGGVLDEFSGRCLSSRSPMRRRFRTAVSVIRSRHGVIRRGTLPRRPSSWAVRSASRPSSSPIRARRSIIKCLCYGRFRP